VQGVLIKSATVVRELARTPIAPQTSALSHSADAASLRQQGILIQGIASLLDSHTLVLVTPENQLLDLLTPTQQQQLYQRMVWEIAFHRQQVRSHALAHRQLNAPLPLLSDRTNLWLPARLLRQFVSWFQVSPVAVGTNLFQESSLTIEASAQIQHPFQPIQAYLNRWPLWQRWLGNPHSASTLTISDAQLEVDPWLSMQDLFGEQTRFMPITWMDERPLPGISPQSTLPPTHDGTTVALPATRTPTQLPRSTEQTQSWVQKFSASFKSAQLERKATSGGEARKSSLQRLRRQNRSSSQPAAASRSIISAVAANPVVASPGAPTLTTPGFDPELTWIEAEATAIGYVKHPLEQILEWLDQILLWLERRFVKVWHWLKRR
jgi:hypothetical protein